MSFVGLVDLASSTLGGHAVECTDDFFASMQNLVAPRPAVWDPDRYTSRGKWMDGWESRRKRGEGHDHCTLKLGVRGVLRAVDIDTSHFLGNHPPFASLEAAQVDGDLARAEWVEVVPQSPLRPGSPNLFTVHDDRAFTHVRLHIYPDGGVARLRTPIADSASVRIGRAIVGDLPPSASGRVSIWLVVTAPLGSDPVPIVVEIEDTDLGVVAEATTILFLEPRPEKRAAD